MRQKDIEDLGGLKEDLNVISTPTSQIAAAIWNELIGDLAALTQIPARAWVNFTTATSGGVYDPVDVSHASIWGSGGGQKPTVTRTGPGLYTVDYASSFALGYTDAAGEEEEETVSFKEAVVVVSTSDATDILTGRRLTVSGPSATIVVKSGSPAAAADIGNSSSTLISTSVFLF